jgi:glycosyltransferase involved in cell wall biosynthesis
MRVIMPQIQRVWCDQILILDGGSTDGTIEWAKAQGYQVYVQNRPGLRQAYIEAWNLIEGDIVVTFSPDGNCLPTLIPHLIAKMKEGYDMVIVSRYRDGAKSHDDNWLTAFGNWFFTKTVNLLHGGHYTDVMVIFRAYKTELVRQLDLNNEQSYATAERLFRTRISWEPLLSVRCAKRKLKVAEIAGDEPPRIGGKAKLQIWRWGAAYYFQFLRELFYWR